MHKTIILPVFYGRETWSVTLRKERRLMMSENRVLKRTFVPKKEEVAGSWRKFHSNGLHSLHSS